jgi:protein-tyrosine phosphatase
MESERVLALEGGLNFRDLGGYPARDGRRIRWRRLFRAGSMNLLTDADYGVLADLGLRAICDLRTAAECEHRPTDWRKIPGLTYWRRDYVQSLGNLEALISGEESSPEAARATMLDIYRALPVEQAPGYRELFRLLAENRLPLVFNCSGGKDRTGLAASLVLSALGTPHEVIVEDYILTNRAFDQEVARKAHSLGPSKLSPEVGQIIGGCHPSYLEVAFAAIADRHGSSDNYLREELGLTAEMRAAIEANLLE